VAIVHLIIRFELAESGEMICGRLVAIK